MSEGELEENQIQPFEDHKPAVVRPIVEVEADADTPITFRRSHAEASDSSAKLKRGLRQEAPTRLSEKESRSSQRPTVLSLSTPAPSKLERGLRQDAPARLSEKEARFSQLSPVLAVPTPAPTKLQRGLRQEAPTRLSEKEDRASQQQRVLSVPTPAPTKLQKGLRRSSPQPEVATVPVRHGGLRGLRQNDPPRERKMGGANPSLEETHNLNDVTPPSAGATSNRSVPFAPSEGSPYRNGGDVENDNEQEKQNDWMVKAKLVEEDNDREQGITLEAQPVRFWDYLRSRAVLAVISLLLVVIITVVVALVITSKQGELNLVLSNLPDYTLDALRDPASHPAQAHEWLKNHPDISSLPQWRKQQLFAMATLYLAASSGGEEDRLGRYCRADCWMDYDVSECDWVQYGGHKECNDEGMLQKLHLFSMNLKGSIPREISLLTSIQIMYLHENDLFGSIPSEIGTMSSLLGLSLARNELTGTIPPEILGLPQLMYFDLSYNQLRGTIPTEMEKLTWLEQFYLNGNQLTSFMPSQTGHLTSLVSLSLPAGIGGGLPEQIGRLSKLTKLDFGRHAFLGSIPTTVGMLTALTRLELNSNSFTGVLPSELGMLTALTSLNLGYNSLSGPLPSEVGKLTELSTLSLEANSLSGLLPSQIGLLSKLVTLDMLTSWSGPQNNFSGPFPTEIGGLSSLTSLVLGSGLTGTIPTTIGMMVGLETLGLSGNHLSGTLPSELGRLTLLTNLRLDNNLNLSGLIPTTVGTMVGLEALDLSGNHLSATLPSELGLLTMLTTLGLDDNLNVSGPIPSELSQLTSMRFLNFADTQLSGSAPWCVEQRRLQQLSQHPQMRPELPELPGFELYSPPNHVPSLPAVPRFIVDCDLVVCNCRYCICHE